MKNDKIIINAILAISALVAFVLINITANINSNAIVVVIASIAFFGIFIIAIFNINNITQELNQLFQDDSTNFVDEVEHDEGYWNEY